MEQYVLLAKGARGRALTDLIQRVTADPSIFAFGELLDVPSIKELENTEHAPSLTTLRLFSAGIWKDYAGGSLPDLTPAQQLKLRQLTVVSIAESMKVVPYDHLMQQLEISEVRQLEDLIISDCFYPKLVKGKLDQKQRCLQIEDAVGRDVQPEHLESVTDGLAHWLQQSTGVLKQLEERIERIQSAAEDTANRRKAEEAQIEDAKKQLKSEFDQRSQEAIGMEDAVSSLEYMDEDRAGGRPKRRR